MTAVIALMGGGAFTANDDIARSLLEGRSGRVLVVPTADAFEEPHLLVEAAAAWGERVGVATSPLMALTRPDARRDDFVAMANDADAVWLVGDSPIHLRTVMKNTPLWAALCAVVDRGGLLVGVGGSAAAMCDPMTDPRGGAFTIGLGLVDAMAVVTETENWSPEQLVRTRQLAGDATFVEMPTGTALIRHGVGGDHRWETVGEVVVHGDLP